MSEQILRIIEKLLTLLAFFAFILSLLWMIGQVFSYEDWNSARYQQLEYQTGQLPYQKIDHCIQKTKNPMFCYEYYNN